MDYEELAETCQELEETDSYLEKNTIIAELLRKTKPEQLEMVIPLLLGRIYPAHASEETGIGLQQLKKAVGRATGYQEKEIDKQMEELGDLGKTAEKLTKKRKQMVLAEQNLTTSKVFENLRKLPEITGEGSVDRKIATVSELLTTASPTGAKFIIRTILGDLRIGVAEGRLRDAIAEAFNIPPEPIEHAYMLANDYGKVAKAAAKKGKKGLSQLDLTIGRPVRPMLAQRSDDIEDIIDRMGGEAAFETKLDGIRIQPHKQGDEIFLFTRRMKDYTHMFPDLEEAVNEAVKPDEAIVDGELVAIDKDTGNPMPFQEVLRRRRKYEIEKVSEEIPVHIYLFDVLLSGGETMIEKPYRERREKLEEMIDPGEKVRVVDKEILEDEREIKSFKKKVVSQGHEGLLAKNLDSIYRAGRREFAWLKLKAEVETLDLVAVGAFAGKGDRAGTYGSYLLAARDPEKGRMKTVSRVGSGFTDKDLEKFTRKFKKIRIEKKPENLDSEIEPDYWFKPQEIFEINYEEIQKSPSETHTSGYGLRFPRYVQIREDLDTTAADTVNDIKKLFEKQEKRKE
uniref:DNA ligase I, ATP-dependent Dnl1 n=1 Tax=uncultured organism TaxID=155900 RepID=M1Q1G5_9ZZZZ|nr:DNA ligase I, ATP-dependent Dnl1 [uncultured organism]